MKIINHSDKLVIKLLFLGMLAVASMFLCPPVPIESGVPSVIRRCHVVSWVFLSFVVGWTIKLIVDYARSDLGRVFRWEPADSRFVKIYVFSLPSLFVVMLLIEPKVHLHVKAWTLAIITAVLVVLHFDSKRKLPNN